MQPSDFEAKLAEDQFGEVTTIQREPNGSLDFHTHPFEAKALILEGEITIGTDQGERVYRPGDIFHLAANTPHTERYGPQGAKYLVGRK